MKLLLQAPEYQSIAGIGIILQLILIVCKVGIFLNFNKT